MKTYPLRRVCGLCGHPMSARTRAALVEASADHFNAHLVLGLPVRHLPPGDEDEDEDPRVG